jgi:hypothetical protein
MDETRHSRARLNRIAYRRLQAQGVEAHISEDEMRVEGVLRLGAGAIFHPMTGESIPVVTFSVEGHNLLRIVSPPEFKHLAPIQFFELPDVYSIVAKLRLTLQTFDALALESDEETVDFSAGLKPGQEPYSETEVIRSPAMDTKDLISGHGEVSQLQPVQPEIEAVTLGELVVKFGPDTVISGNAVYVRDFQIKDRRLRMSFWQKSARTFFGRLNEGEESLWQDTVELDRFPNADDFASMILDVPLSAEAMPADSLDLEEDDTHSEFKLPVEGERWAMEVLVEGKMGAEVRYTPMNTEGKPFGAPRLLPQETFDATFFPSGGGYRLLVKVVEADVVRVSYVHLDPGGKRKGRVRVAPTEAFKANFYHLFADEQA